ncbi:MAG: tRNA epoxyqueuosine(34) reductase QueG [Chloroflexi bacterium]|nr:tRNA epoxyqueuosine(34) reductase QueG [Chloroflexota bacterium]
MSITTEIKEFAWQIGFDLVGISTAEPLAGAEAVVVERVRAGLFGGMDWLTEDRARLACRPQELLPAARSIISVACSYLSDTPTVFGASAEPRGRIARYAWSRDYHDVLRDRMRLLVSFIERRAGRRVESRLFVDTGPLVERQLALRAGIGWYGKSTNILTRRYGSWVLLGEVFLDLDLDVDDPLQKSCGNCDACISACPTGAIASPYLVDSRRCISYLTIELKGSVPPDLRPAMGSWIFGCDICQDVCPVNRRAKAGNHEFSQPLPQVESEPGLLSLLALTVEDHREKFRASPVWRAKRRGLIRNVAIALANAGDTAAVPALARAMEDAEPLVRAHSAWALGRLGSRQARETLELASARETDESVRAEIKQALMS